MEYQETYMIEFLLSTPDRRLNYNSPGTAAWGRPCTPDNLRLIVAVCAK